MLIGKAVLPELSHEESQLGCVAAEQVREYSEEVHYILLTNFVVQVKSIECFLDLTFKVNAYQFRAVENQFHSFLRLHTFTLEHTEDRLELFCCLGQDVGVLDNESANELNIETVFRYEKFFERQQTCLCIVLPEEESWLVSHHKLKLLGLETKPGLRLLLKGLQLIN